MALPSLPGKPAESLAAAYQFFPQGDFDLSNKQIAFVPDPSFGGYSVSVDTLANVIDLEGDWDIANGISVVEIGKLSSLRPATSSLCSKSLPNARQRKPQSVPAPCGSGDSSDKAAGGGGIKVGTAVTRWPGVEGGGIKVGTAVTRWPRGGGYENESGSMNLARRTSFVKGSQCSPLAQEFAPAAEYVSLASKASW